MLEENSLEKGREHTFDLISREWPIECSDQTTYLASFLVMINFLNNRNSVYGYNLSAIVHTETTLKRYKR